jgi:hypothetical protein
MIGLLFLAVSPLLATPPAQPPDFLAYIDEIRKAGASEDAQAQLRGVASIMVGNSIIDFPKDPVTGRYGKSYRSTSCPAPGLSREAREKLLADAAARVEPVFKRLREFADTDHSGFVSTREGWEVRLTFEFGAELADLLPQEGKDKAKLCKLLNVTSSEFDQRLKAYRSFVEWFANMKVRYLPPVPAIGTSSDAPSSGLE